MSVKHLLVFPGERMESLWFSKNKFMSFMVGAGLVLQPLVRGVQSTIQFECYLKKKKKK